MKELLADFHIHSLLSPCAEVEMTPHHIILRAAQYGIGAVAITDHNASGNIPAALEAGAKYGIVVLPGMEVECAEEAHIVVLFDTMEQMDAWQQIIDASRSGLKNVPEKFGGQFVVDAEDNFIREEEKMLLGSCRLTAAEVVDKCHALGGICWAAHIDKRAYSLLTQLGFIGSSLQIDGAEISRNSLAELSNKKLKPLVDNKPYLTNSDAHMIDDFIHGPKNLLRVEQVNTTEIKKALQNIGGRSLQPGAFVTEKV